MVKEVKEDRGSEGPAESELSETDAAFFRPFFPPVRFFLFR